MKRQYNGKLKESLRNFCRCGIAGWCLEVIFTSSESWMRGDMRLMGRTSLWMFPIYGMGVLLPGIVNTADRWLTGLSAFPEAGTDRISPPARLVRHGLMDMVLIFTAEYVTGTILKHFNVCPWDYSMWPDHIGGVIRLAFGPLVGRCCRRHRLHALGSVLRIPVLCAGHLYHQGPHRASGWCDRLRP